MAQENDQDMKDRPPKQHTQKRFPLPGKSTDPVYQVNLPASLHATFLTAAGKKNAFSCRQPNLTQRTRSGTLFFLPGLEVHEPHENSAEQSNEHMNYQILGETRN